MTQYEMSSKNDIIEMAEQAGMIRDGDMWFSFGKGDMDVEHKHLETFAKLVEAKASAKEREACAKLCIHLANKWTRLAHWGQNTEYRECAEAIRARGEQQ